MMQHFGGKEATPDKLADFVMEDHDSFSWLNLNQKCLKQNLNESFGFQNMRPSEDRLAESDNFEVYQGCQGHQAVDSPSNCK